MRANERSTVLVGVSPHAPYTVSDELYREVAAFAAAARLPVAVHIAESAAETDYVVRGSGSFAEALHARGIGRGPRARSPVSLLAEMGILGAGTLLIHAIDVDERDVDLIRSHGASVAHCPVSNAKLGHGVAPVMKYIDAGITVGLGTDSVISNNRMDMLDEAHHAALLQRARAGRADLLPASLLLEMLTLGGARALGIDSLVGTLEPGKRADIAAFNLSGAHSIPLFDPCEVLIHSLRGADAVFVAVDGRVLMRGRAMETDLSREETLLRQCAARIARSR
jgi:5-methylthioadenosine/S-adenosylhomocysteine deaminase